MAPDSSGPSCEFLLVVASFLYLLVPLSQFRLARSGPELAAALLVAIFCFCVRDPRYPGARDAETEASWSLVPEVAKRSAQPRCVDAPTAVAAASGIVEATGRIASWAVARSSPSRKPKPASLSDTDRDADANAHSRADTLTHSAAASGPITTNPPSSP